MTCRSSIGNMDFKHDLVDIIRRYFAKEGISYRASAKPEDLAARYCEMRVRRIDPAPRHVYFSNELHDTLGGLASEIDSEERAKALEAWNAVFRLHHLFTIGAVVTPYLSKWIRDATSKDGLLWDYGMHHLHLRKGVDESGFVRRADYLLFAIVGDDYVCFVDVRKHHDPQDLQWVRQDLLKIVHANWPAITDAHVLHGVQGSTVTDVQKKELRRKHVQTVSDLDGVALAPLGWGTMMDGSSTWCRLWADKLLSEIEWHETTLDAQLAEAREVLVKKGADVSSGVDLRLVPLDTIDVSPECAEELQRGDHSSKGLYAMGFAIVEATSGYPVTITYTAEA